MRSRRRAAHVAALGVSRPYGRLGSRGRPRLRHPARSVLCPEPGRPGAADLRPDGENGHLPFRQVRGPDGGPRDRRPLGVPRAGAGARPRQGPRHHAIPWLVRQPPPRYPFRHAASGRACHCRCAARDRRRAATRADRGHPPLGQRPYGGPPAADLRGGPPRVPVLPWPHADRRIHHPGVGDRPGPHAPARPRLARVPHRRAESPLDPGTVGPGPHAPTDGGPPRLLSCTPTPRRRAGTFGVREGPIGASRGPPAAPCHPSLPRTGRPRRRAIVAAVTPTPARWPSRARGPRRILGRPPIEIPIATRSSRRSRQTAKNWRAASSRSATNHSART